MTMIDTARNPASIARSNRGIDSGQTAGQSETNVGQSERAVSIAAGAVAALLGLSRGSLPGLVIAGVGGALVYRGVTGSCPAYSALGMDTAHGRDAGTTERETHERGIHVEEAFLINRPAADLYAYWRDFTNLPRIMTHLESVRIIDERRSHWVAKAPAIAGGWVEWDAEITQDEPNARIAWRSLAGSSVDNAGEIRFAPAMGDRGTEVHVTMDYVPPAGRLGHWVAKLFGEAPTRTMREDLRNFKRLMETGELPTVDGQPHGTCTGQGELHREPASRRP